MSKSAMCRACLSQNIKMYPLDTTRYQDLYEKHSGDKLMLGGSKPETVCYICNSQIQRFYKFLQMSENSEKYLTKLYGNGMELSQDLNHALSEVSSILHSMSVTDASASDEEHPSDVAIKIESLDNDDNDDIDLAEMNSNSRAPPEHVEPEDVQIKVPMIKKVSVKLERLPLKKMRQLNDTHLTCTLCPRRFRSAAHLNTHKQTVHRKHTKCKECFKTFSSTLYLQRHMRLHDRNPKHVCDVCERRFYHRSMLFVHVRTHTGEKPFSCKWCDKTFSDKSNCRKHMKTHTGSRHACFLCDRTFTQWSRLKQHAVEHIL